MDVGEFGVQLIWTQAGNDLHWHRWRETIRGGESQTQWWSITRILRCALMGLNIGFKWVCQLLVELGGCSWGVWAVPVPVSGCHLWQGGFTDAVRNIFTKKWASSPQPCSQQKTQLWSSWGFISWVCLCTGGSGVVCPLWFWTQMCSVSICALGQRAVLPRVGSCSSDVVLSQSVRPNFSLGITSEGPAPEHLS